MAYIVILESGKLPQVLDSANTPDYQSNPNALINPDVSAVAAVPLKYWKKGLSNNVIEMTLSEKQAVDTADLATRKSLADTLGIGPKETLTALIKVINIRLPAGQKITYQEMVDAIKQEIT